MDVRRFLSSLCVLLLLVCFGAALGAAPQDPIWGVTLPLATEDVLNHVALGPDGTIYAGSLDGFLYAINPDKTLKWAYDTGSSITTDPAIRHAAPGEDPQHNGTVYIGLGDGRVLAINPAGGLDWTVYMGCVVCGAPAIAKDGTIYVGARSSQLVAINPDGSTKWVFPTIETAAVQDPVVGPDGTIYFGTSWENRFYAVNPDGSQEWVVNLEFPVTTSPAIARDGMIYVGAQWKLYAIYPWGGVEWMQSLWGQIYASPAIGADGTIYACADTLVAHNTDGSEKWHFHFAGMMPGVHSSSPAVDANGVIYFGSLDNHLYAVHPDGSFYWRFNGYSQIHSSPLIDDDGVLCMCSSHSVYGFDTGASGPANSTWPMYRQDPARNGRLDTFLILTLDVKKLLRRVIAAELNTGIEKSLVPKLESALQALDMSRLTPAKNNVKAFINHVSAQRAKKIPVEAADVLIRDARAILMYDGHD